jgi:hypothetical protein
VPGEDVDKTGLVSTTAEKDNLSVDGAKIVGVNDSC